MPVAYTCRYADGKPRTREGYPYNPTELFADVGKDNSSGYTAFQVAIGTGHTSGSAEPYSVWLGRNKRWH